MSLRSEWPCWEIMKCDKGKDCRVKENTDKTCWEIIREIDACSFNICRDCLVYISKQKDCILSKEEILSILVQKGVDVLNGENRCPQFKQAAGKDSSQAGKS